MSAPSCPRRASITTAVDPVRFSGAVLGPAMIDVRPRPDTLDPDVYIKPEDFARVFAADVPPAQHQRMAATQHPLVLTAQLAPSGPTAWRTIPAWDLITLDDNAIPPAGQEYMAQRARAQADRVHSAHAVIVAHPDAVTAIVLDATAAVSG